MKLRVLGCSGGQVPGHNLSSFLINDSLLVDAGSATSTLTLKAQQKIRNILITHVHLDHVMGLATIADNLYGNCESTINVWGINDVISGLKSSFFNDTIWPDFTQITGDSQGWPVVSFRNMPEEEPIPIGNSTVTAVRVNHIVPSVAFFIEREKRTLLMVGDTGPTEKVWAIARRKKNLCAVVLESSFPNRLQEIADMSRHLTPRTLAEEADKLKRPSVPILVTHLKPQFRDETIAELKRLRGYRLRVLKQSDTLVF
jgi:3',5'-cyclic-nucleotide phosphodiesterase